MRPLILVNFMVNEKRSTALSQIAYSEAVIRAGGLPLVLTAFTDTDAIRSALAVADGVLFVGGPDYHPEVYGGRAQPETQLMDRRRHDADLQLAQAALAGRLPILGVCGGLQLMVIAQGGTLIQDISEEIPEPLPHQYDGSGKTPAEHAVRMVPGTRLQAMLGDEIQVNTYHHQAAHPERTGSLVVSARASDGVVEAVEDPGHPFRIGVQWHPERMTDSASAVILFSRFVAAAHLGRDSASGRA